MLAPAVLLVGVLLLYPAARTIHLSVFEDSGLGESTYVGIDNYRRLFEDDVFGRAVANTLIWVGGSLLLPVGLGLGIAALSTSVARGSLVRVPIILPYAISGAATGAVIAFMLRGDGAVNTILGVFGLDGLERNWLLTWPANTLSVVVAHAWQATGVNVILFLVGLQTIPRDTVEAGRLDGAGGWSLFRHVVFPQLRPVTVVAVGIALANSLKTFDLVWVTTQGGPGRSSETLAVTMYRETFVLFHQGYGAAIAVVLSAVVIVTSWAYLRRQMPDIR